MSILLWQVAVQSLLISGLTKVLDIIRQTEGFFATVFVKLAPPPHVIHYTECLKNEEPMRVKLHRNSFVFIIYNTIYCGILSL